MAHCIFLNIYLKSKIFIKTTIAMTVLRITAEIISFEIFGYLTLMHSANDFLLRYNRILACMISNSLEVN